MSGQNTSHAVMAQRVEAPDSFDDFPTPPWATRALIEHVLLRRVGPAHAEAMRQMTVLEPACNRGYMAGTLGEYFRRVIARDIMDYGYPLMEKVDDFLFPGPLPRAHWMITNPPFRLAENFVHRSFDMPGWCGTAVFLRTQWVEGEGRFRDLFTSRPPTIIAPFAERVPLFKGILRDPDKEYFDEAADKWKKPSTATSYSWFVWVKNRAPQPPIWIPPCRLALTRAGDYPATKAGETE